MSEIAIAHEHYPARGGGEIVADELATTFDAPIVTGWIADNDHSEHEPVEILENTPVSFLRPYMSNPLVRDLFYAFAWESVPTLRDFDVLIQSGNACSWYVPEQKQTVIKYNHSPPRNPYDLFWRDESHTANWHDLINPGYVVDRLFKKFTRQVWANRTEGIDLWVCNSELIKHRTKKYLGVPERKLTVVYPPVDVEQYEPTATENHYICLSRLEVSKRIATVVEAFADLPHELKIVGDGNERERLETLAAPHENIELTGYVSEPHKRELLQNAKASLFMAENEDFGIVPIESMAAGTPVIGVNDGFTQYQVRHGRNGYLCERSPAAIKRQVKNIDRNGVAWTPEQMHQFTQQFAVDRFRAEMRELVAQAREQNQINVTLKTPELAIND